MSYVVGRTEAPRWLADGGSGSWAGLANTCLEAGAWVTIRSRPCSPAPQPVFRLSDCLAKKPKLGYVRNYFFSFCVQCFFNFSLPLSFFQFPSFAPVTYGVFTRSSKRLANFQQMYSKYTY